MMAEVCVRPRDQRKQPRTPVDGGIQMCINQPEPRRATVRMRNISRQGIGLRLDALVAIGTELVLEAPAEVGEEMLQLRARVVYCVFDPVYGDYLLGCQFVRELRSHELFRLF